MVLTARGPEQQSKGTDTVGAWINLCLATGRAGPPAVRLRLPHRAGQRAGRARARPEGRPAARLPQADRPGGARAMSPRCGASTRTRCPGPGRSAYELLDALGADVTVAAADGLEPGGVRAPRRAHRGAAAVAGLPGRRGRRAVRDGGARGCRPARSPSGRRRRARRPAWRAASCCAAGRSTPPAGVRSDLEVLHGLAARLGVEKGFPTDPEEVFEELRRALGGRAGGLLGDHVPAARGGGRGCSGRAPRSAGAEATPARPGSSSTGSPPTDGRARFVAVAHRAAAEEPDDGVPGAADHRAGRRPVPVGRPDPARRRAERRRARPLRGAASAARRAARGGRRATASPSSPGAGGPSRRRGSPTPSAPTRSSCRSTGRARAAPTP